MSYKIQKEESRRYDALKVVMCIFVLLIHSFSDKHPAEGGGYGFSYACTFVISRIICDCAVPVFILISSVLLYAKPIGWWANVKKKCRSLLVPYLIFDSLWIVMLLCKHILVRKLGMQVEDDVDLTTWSLFDWLDAYLGLSGNFKPVLTVLWYLRDLFILNLLAVPVKKLVDLLPIPTLVLALAIWLLDIPTPGIQAYSLVFFILGCHMVKFGIHFQDIDRKADRYLLLTAYVILLVADIWLWRENAYVDRAFILVSVVFWIRCSGRMLRFDKAIRLILPATFFIYLTHRFVYVIMQMVLEKLVLRSFIVYVLKPSITLGALLAVFYLMRKLMPGVLSLMIGGRVGERPSGRVRR